MTFVLNLLHKDFSLLTADRQGNSEGPTTIQLGATTVHINGRTTIEGLGKIFLSEDERVALGYAGVTSAHQYVDKFKQAKSATEAMTLVRSHVEEFLDFDQRDVLLAGTPQMENSALMSFFDAEKSAYWAHLSVFTRFESHSVLYARAQNPMPFLVHTGSGSAHFEKAVGLEAINAFVEDVKDGASLETQLTWIRSAFEKVSLVAPGCGATFDAYLSTRSSPAFRKIQ